MHDPRTMAMMGGSFGGAGGCCELPRGNNVITGTGGGGLVRVLPETEFSFDDSADPAVTIVLAKYIDTTMWVSGALIVRMHSITTVAGATIHVKVQNASYAEEDPSTYFVDSTEVASVAVSAGTAGTAEVAALTAPLAAQKSVVLVADGTGGAGGTFGCTIGVDLVGRTS